SMSSRQCFGGGGSSSGAIISFSSTPHTLHRYLTFTRRISPEGGGSGGGEGIDLSSAMPGFHSTTAITRPAATQTTVEKAGTTAPYRRVSPGLPPTRGDADDGGRPPGWCRPAPPLTRGPLGSG